MNYWLVNTANIAFDESHSSQMKKFIKNSIWENFDPFRDIGVKKSNQINVGDYLYLKDGAYIRYYAKCTKNLKDIQKVMVDKWKELRVLIPLENYHDVVVEELKEKDIQKIKNYFEFEIKSLTLDGFMSFKDKKINFSSGINIFIGENGSGKSQILKLLYSVIDENNINFLDKSNDREREKNIALSIKDVFKAEKIGNLVSKNSKSGKAKIDIDFSIYKLSFSFIEEFDKKVIIENFREDSIENPSIFIPAKEVLSFYPGFRLLYERKYLEFDKTYYNLCKALETPLNREESNEIVLKLIDKLENILEGKIFIKNGRFYLKQESNSYEISIVAEGLRKVAMLTYLLSNGSLNENSTLFWDEPEANMHPKLIKEIVEILVILANSGIQIFIATHSPYVLELFNNHLKRDKIKDLNIEDKEIKEFPILSPSETSAYYLRNGEVINILNEEFGLIDDKLLSSFNDITRFYDKMRDIEWNS